MEAQYVPAAGEPPRVRNRKPKPRNPGDQGSQAVHGQQPPNRKSNRAPQPAATGYDEYGYNPDYGYAGEHVDAHGYGYGSAHLDAAGQDYGHGYVAGAQANAVMGNYDEQGYGHGYGYDAAGQEYGHVAPAQHAQGNLKKSRVPRPVAGAEVQGDYANPEAYNAVDPSQQKRESKPRRTKPQEKRNHDNGGVPEPGSARLRTSQEGSGSNRSQRQDGIARDQESVHSGRSGSARSGGRSMTRPTEATGNNALNEHVRKAGGGKPPMQDVSMAVFDPRDRTEARPTLDEWMKKQGNLPVQQDESLIVFDDRDKEELETRMFGAPLPKPNKPPPMKLAPLQEEQQQQQQRPQYQPRVGGAAPNLASVPADDRPLYQPGERRGRPSPAPQGGAVQAYNKPVYNNDDANNMEIQAVQPNPNCMACVHGVGVPIARLATRIACKNACLCCTIL